MGAPVTGMELVVPGLAVDVALGVAGRVTVGLVVGSVTVVVPEMARVPVAVRPLVSPRAVTVLVPPGIVDGTVTVWLMLPLGSEVTVPRV